MQAPKWGLTIPVFERKGYRSSKRRIRFPFPEPGFPRGTGSAARALGMPFRLSHNIIKI